MRFFVGIAPILVTTIAACTSLQTKDCAVHLRYDGGQTKRPYYAVEVCADKVKVLCDSDKPLPQPDCP